MPQAIAVGPLLTLIETRRKNPPSLFPVRVAPNIANASGQSGADFCELRRYFGAHGSDGGDDHDGDQTRDQSILDRSGTGLVGSKSPQ